MSDFVAVPSITVLCYLLAEGYKLLASENAYKHIPVYCGGLGGVLGVLCHLFLAGYLPADNLLAAAAIGVVSGWAATGAHQICKQERGR